MKWPSTLVVLLSCVLVVFSGQSLYAQLADRAEITGIVTDASGAAVPDAKVSIVNQDTGTKIVVGTNSAGNYSTPPLQLGTYTIEVEKEGFKHATHPGIMLSGAQSFRQDVKLELGSVTQSVEVEGGAELINTENSTVSHTIGSTYYRDLPGVMGADIRLAESLLQLQPGFVPMQPNGDAIFRGSQFTSRINGGQTMATENWFDGAAFGYAEGHQGTQESSVPYTSVQEMTVVENTFSAQYGHTSGGFITYITKSGKTFWFVNVDGLDYHSTVNTGFVNTLPTPLQRQGDFSEFLGAQATATCAAGTPNAGTVYPITDLLGRPILSGQIFNPASTRTVTNTVLDPCTGSAATRTGPVRDPYTGNVIPANDPLRSPLAAFTIPNIPALDRNQLKQNGFGGNSDDNNKINVRTWLFRIDHTFNSKFSISNPYYQNNRPRTAHCGGPQ